MYLPEEKQKIISCAANDSSGKFPGKLGRLCQNIYLYDGDHPNEERPTRGDRISKTLHTAGLSDRFLSWVFMGDDIFGAGLQSIVFNRGEKVQKYLIMPLGKLATTIQRFHDYETMCLNAANEVFSGMIPETDIQHSTLNMRPLGRVATLSVVQQKINKGYALFSDYGMSEVASSRDDTDGELFENTRIFLRSNRHFRDEYGVDIDVCSGNVLVLPDGSISIVDYDPDLPSNYLDIPRYRLSAEHRTYWINKMSEITR